MKENYQCAARADVVLDLAKPTSCAMKRWAYIVLDLAGTTHHVPKASTVKGARQWFASERRRI